jgi:CBS domain-containing protein
METAIRNGGSTADRYATALERYVSAMSVSGETGRSVDSHRHDAFPPLTVADVMTTGIVTAYEGALFKDIARALHRNGINAVPVINEDRHVLGVTVSDLLARIDQSRPLPPSHRSAGRAERRRKRHARTARELMTTPPITTRPKASLAEAARLFHRYRLRSRPVIDHTSALVGMVSRADLIALFLRTDEDIKDDRLELDVNDVRFPARR